MANISNYGELIKDLDARCQQSIVCIRIYSDKNRNQLLDVGTGIVIASEERSCFIMTSSGFIGNHIGYNKKVGDVELFDGTVHQLVWSRCYTHKEITIFHILIHLDAVNFSGNEIMEGQKVFTIGYNYNMPDKRYISGNIVCGANIINGQATQFVHGSSTGKHGHQGSAVVNEERQLVGMNVSYTISEYIDYSKDNEPAIGAQTKRKPAIGGLVSALHLDTIKHRLEYLCFQTEDNSNSLDQSLTRLRIILRNIQDKP